VIASTQVPDLDVSRLSDWLRKEGLTNLSSLNVGQVSQPGHTNEVYLVHAGPARWVLRRSGSGQVRSGGMKREYTVLRALEGSDVPHPRPIALCEDPDVLGTPFMLMEFVSGFKGLPDSFPPEFRSPAVHRQMALDFIATLGKIHRVAWRDCGLEGFGRPDSFLDRQVDRWLRQLDTYRDRALPFLELIVAWLRENVPSTRSVGLMHGDYSGGNVFFAPDLPARIAAVLDWENCTIGDPLLDLASVVREWPEGGTPDVQLFEGEHRRIHQLPGIPGRTEMLEVWSAVSGRPVPDLAYYDVLSRFRVAVILEGSYQRWRTGVSSDPYHAVFENRVPRLLSGAAAIVRDRST
jgi:aminoglycoside phosphotransferase (APT) family kinase protein